MKKILATIMIIFFMVGIASADCTESQYQISSDGTVLVVKLACTGSAIDGSVADKTLDTSAVNVSSGLPKSYWHMGFVLWSVWTVAGTGIAPDAADIQIVTALDKELFNTVGALQATGTTLTVAPMPPRSIESPITISHANQATVSATWDTYIEMRR